MSPSMNRIERLDRHLRKIGHILAAIGATLLLLQASSIVLDATVRWLFNRPLHGMEDVNSIVIAVTVSCFLPALFMERGNVTITLLGRMLGPRLSAWLDMFGQTLALAFIAIVAWQYGTYAADLTGHHTIIIELPKQPSAWVATGFISLAALLQCMVVLVTAVRAINAKNTSASSMERA